MSDRRQFLKLFGAGVNIIPIIGGIPIASAESRLLAAPFLEPEEPSMVSKVEGIFTNPEKQKITVIMEGLDTGKRLILNASAFVISTSLDSRPLMNYQNAVRHNVVVARKVTWKMEGELVDDILWSEINKNGIDWTVSMKGQGR